MLRDLRSGQSAKIEMALSAISATRPDILLLTEFDYDATGAALSALKDRLDVLGHPMPHHFAKRGNTGRQEGMDLDLDGRLGEPEDAHGYGLYSGQGGMAILSRFPIDSASVRDFSDLAWHHLPGSRLAETKLQSQDKKVLRLASDGHWIVPVNTPYGMIRILALHAQTPVFDGPEDRNGLRNADQLRFWHMVLDGAYGAVPEPVALIGNTNIDPDGGDGMKQPMTALLAHPRLQDPHPNSRNGQTATVDWPEDGPGDLRVSYVLPSVMLEVDQAGVYWPAQQQEGPAHKLVWVDVRLPPEQP